MTDYEEYLLLKEMGMFWEMYPKLTGNWEEDAPIFGLRNNDKQQGESV